MQIFQKFLWFFNFGLTLWGLPYNPSVLVGEVYFEESDKKLFVTARDDSKILWEHFSIDPDEAVEFIGNVENHAESCPSRIRGEIVSRTRVHLRSPEGIYVGLTALLQAPVVEIFSGGLVVNQGAIQGNLIRLEGGEIQNQGSFEGTDVQLLGTALEKPLERFDGLQALAMPGSTIIHSGAVVAETAFIQAEYIDLQKESSIVGKMILIGGEKTRIVKINGEIAGEEIQAFSDAALINHGKIQGKIEAKAPYLWELP